MEGGGELVYYCSHEDVTLRGRTYEELFEKVDKHLITVHHDNRPCGELDRFLRSQMKIVY